MDTWGPGWEHWAVGHNFYAIMVDVHTDGTMPKFITALLKEISTYEQIDLRTSQMMPRETVMVRCDAAGVPIDAIEKTPTIELITEHKFPPGTSAEDALVSLGCEVI